MGKSRDEAVDTLRSVAEEQCGVLRTAAMAIEAEIKDYPFESRQFWNNYVDLMRDAAVELHKAAFAVQRASTKKWRTFAGALVIAATTGGAEGATGVIGETFFEPGTPVAESLGAAAIELERPTEEFPAAPPFHPEQEIAVSELIDFWDADMEGVFPPRKITQLELADAVVGELSLDQVEALLSGELSYPSVSEVIQQGWVDVGQLSLATLGDIEHLVDPDPDA